MYKNITPFHSRHSRTIFNTLCTLFTLLLLTSCSGSSSHRKPPSLYGKNSNSTTTYGSSSDYNNRSSASNYKGDGSAFISPKALNKDYLKVAVLPFKSEVEIAGASVADMVTNELLKTYKYDLIERGQIEQILQEQTFGLQGVTDNSVAMQVGKVLGVQAVIVGTVPEFATRIYRGNELPSVGISFRMIDTESGSIIWTVSKSAISRKVMSTSTFADRLVKMMIGQLKQEWIRIGDTYAVNLPSPQIIDSHGFIRKAVIQVFPESRKKVKSYTLLRSRTKNGPYTKVATIPNRSKNVIFEDKQLLDAETYYYKVTASHISGLNGPPAGPVKISTKGAPNSLTGSRAESGGLRECKIFWSPSSDQEVAGYDILRAENQAGPFKKIAHVKKRTSNTYIDKDGGRNSRYGNLRDDFTYYYKIKAVNIVGVQSPDSQIFSATTAGIPPSVANLQAESNMLRKVSLSWTPSTNEYVKGYEILRSETQNGPYTLVTVIKGRDKGEYIDMGSGSSWGKAGKLEDKKTYYYTIKALNLVDVRSLDSNIVQAETRGKPPVVTGFLAEGGLPRKVHLLWQPSSGEFVDGYAIFRSLSPSGPFEEIKQLSGRDHSDYMDKDTASSWGEVGKLMDNTTYYYQIRSINIVDVKSEESETISAVTKPMLDKVSGLRAIENQVQQVALSWYALDCKEYEIFRGESASKIEKSIATVGSKTLNYTDKNLENGKQYYYKVRAIDSFDLPGIFSPVVGARTKPLPNKPTNLTHSLNGNQLILTWDQNSEPDVVSYKVMKKGFFSWTVAGETQQNSYSPETAMEKGGEFLYKVIAVDKDGLESESSDETKIAVPE